MELETKPQMQESESSNIVLYILLFIVIVLTGFIVYLYSSNTVIKKEEFKEKYVLKSEVNFTMLPTYEKSRYVEFYEHTNQINELKQELKLLENNNGNQRVVERIVKVEKIVKVPVEKVIEKIVEVEKVITVTKNNKDEVKQSIQSKPLQRTFQTYTCKSMNSGSIKISEKCKKELENFLDVNKNSSMFEIIGMVDNQDFKLINKLKDVYGEKKIEKISKYSQIGLSRQRVIEATWLIKKYVEKDKDIKTVNYTINGKDKKGFIVRAYK